LLHVSFNIFVTLKPRAVSILYAFELALMCIEFLFA